MSQGWAGVHVVHGRSRESRENTGVCRTASASMAASIRAGDRVVEGTETARARGYSRPSVVHILVSSAVPPTAGRAGVVATFVLIHLVSHGRLGHLTRALFWFFFLLWC